MKNMDKETKLLIRKAFSIGKILFSLSPQKYAELRDAVQKVSPPKREDIGILMENRSLEDAIILDIKTRYAAAAVLVGLTEKHGIAMLEYATLSKEIEDE
jgi:hypothetical protein